MASDDPRVTGVVAAMPEEMAPLRSRMSDAKRIVGHGIEIVSGRIGGMPVVLAVTGDGERNARVGIAALLAAVRLDRLIAIGVAGALSRDLAAGVLVVADRVVTEDGGEAFHADAPSSARAALQASARRGLVVTARRIADTVAEKQRLLAAAQAGSLVAVVDLESAAYAAAATRAALPFVVVRAVSDTADEALPALLNRCRDKGGAVRRGRVAFELLGDPGALPILLSLRQRVRLGAEALARATEAILLGADDAPVAAPRVAHGARGGI
jgi:adenosylhomocysteine nucleosidase